MMDSTHEIQVHIYQIELEHKIGKHFIWLP